MRASAISAHRSPPRRRATWLSRAQRLIADLVLPVRLGHGAVSLLEIEGR